MQNRLVDSLTPAERNVLRLMTSRRVTDTKRIAALIGTSPGTVKTQINSAMRKLGVNSRTAAAALLREDDDEKQDEPHEPGGTPVSTPSPIPIFTPAGMIDGTAGDGDYLPRRSRPMPMSVQEERAVSALGARDHGTADLRRRVNSLSAGLRIVVIAIIVIMTAVFVLLTVPTSNKAQVVGGIIANQR